MKKAIFFFLVMEKSQLVFSLLFFAVFVGGSLHFLHPFHFFLCFIALFCLGVHLVHFLRSGRTKNITIFQILDFRTLWKPKAALKGTRKAPKREGSPTATPNGYCFGVLWSPGACMHMSLNCVYMYLQVLYQNAASASSLCSHYHGRPSGVGGLQWQWGAGCRWARAGRRGCAAAPRQHCGCQHHYLEQWVLQLQQCGPWDVLCGVPGAQRVQLQPSPAGEQPCPGLKCGEHCNWGDRDVHSGSWTDPEQHWCWAGARCLFASHTPTLFFDLPALPWLTLMSFAFQMNRQPWVFFSSACAEWWHLDLSGM